MDKFDRCDACGAEALTSWSRNLDQALMFCGHHTHKVADKLMAVGWTIVEDVRVKAGK